MVYDEYNRLKKRAEDLADAGYHRQASVLATLALAEATMLNAPESKIEIFGSITVDT